MALQKDEIKNINALRKETEESHGFRFETGSGLYISRNIFCWPNPMSLLQQCFSQYAIVNGLAIVWIVAGLCAVPAVAEVTASNPFGVHAVPIPKGKGRGMLPLGRWSFGVNKEVGWKGESSKGGLHLYLLGLCQLQWRCGSEETQ